MHIQKMITEHLNAGQVPVRHLISHYLHWPNACSGKWPEIYGEEIFLVMFGGLHIELALWKTIGDFLENSGWTAALT